MDGMSVKMRGMATPAIWILINLVASPDAKYKLTKTANLANEYYLSHLSFEANVA